MNTRRKLIVALAASSVAMAFGARAQAPGKIFRIGFLTTVAPMGTPNQVGFRDGLRELGYVEGKNIAIEYRWVEGDIKRLPGLAAELVGLKVDLIFVWGTPAVAAAKQATSTIPIVFAGVGDPVGSGFVASLARPGGNITGFSNLSAGLAGKELEILSEVVPGIKRVAVLRNPGNPVSALQLKEVETAARSLGVQLQRVEFHAPEDLANAFASMSKERAAGVVMLSDPTIVGQFRRIAELAIKRRLPSIYPNPGYAEAGGLMSYGANGAVQFRRAASYVDRIFKGTKPADLPVEQPTKFELIINGKTAKALGIKISNSILLRAERVIE
jgi:putative ABC transport system substrate-binding protein